LHGLDSADKLETDLEKSYRSEDSTSRLTEELGFIIAVTEPVDEKGEIEDVLSIPKEGLRMFPPTLLCFLF
jgi:hypothetical protein